VPIVELHVLKGYDADVKRRLCEALTDAVRLIIPAAPEAITVIVHEMIAENYSRGRKQRRPAPALGDPGQIVKLFLEAMEARDIENARSMLGEGFEMKFPGTGTMSRLEELIEWARPRYRFVRKSYEGVDVMQSPGDAALVYCRGTLSGEWHSGEPFEGIRFIDRFEVTEGKITRQDVWNDMAEMKAQA